MNNHTTQKGLFTQQERMQKLISEFGQDPARNKGLVLEYLYEAHQEGYSLAIKAVRDMAHILRHLPGRENDGHGAEAIALELERRMK